MALQSKLFRNDAKLESAAISDSAHIVPGASGEHVRKIQQALKQLDSAVIDADGNYGPKTAAAVLAYKQKRGIVNRTYQTRADNIVGRMTMERLDKEMFEAEPAVDIRTIRCVFPPDTQRSVRRTFAVGGGPGEITGFKLLEEARASLPLAKSWVAVTLAKIAQIEGKIERFKVYTAAEIAFFASIETHFKVNIPVVSESVARDRLLKIKVMFGKIQKVLTTIATDRIVGNPGVPDKALGPLGGFDIAGEVITIGRDFHDSNANMRAAVLIHEGGHFAAASCSHAASEQPSPSGSAILDSFGAKVNPGKLNYAQLDFNLHMQNAYSFAQCAMHNGLGVDQRPP